MAPDSEATLAWRVRRLEQDMENNAEPALKLVAQHEEQINGKTGVIKAVDALAEEVRALRRVMMGVGASVVGAAVVLTILQRVLPS